MRNLKQGFRNLSCVIVCVTVVSQFKFFSSCCFLGISSGALSRWKNEGRRVEQELEGLERAISRERQDQKYSILFKALLQRDKRGPGCFSARRRRRLQKEA